MEKYLIQNPNNTKELSRFPVPSNRPTILIKPNTFMVSFRYCKDLWQIYEENNIVTLVHSVEVLQEEAMDQLKKKIGGTCMQWNVLNPP